MTARWKKNLLKVPASTRLKIRELAGDDIIVAAAKKIPEADIRTGVYRHLGIRISGDELEFPESVLPPVQSGRWSRTNQDGKDIKRRDLPMVTKTYAVETPNWGDASTYGTHTVYFDRDVYQVDLIPPKYLQINISLLREETTGAETAYVLKFEIDEVLSITDEDFLENLLYDMNVLQENTGVSDVFASDTSIDEYLAMIEVDWEIFPPGTREDDIRRILSGVRSSRTIEVVRERYDALRRLSPTHIIRGSSGFQRYFGAMFADDLVVFENLRYGNAIYVMYEDWRELSQRSRLELLSGDREGFERIPHTAGWESQLRYLVKNHRGERLDG